MLPAREEDQSVSFGICSQDKQRRGSQVLLRSLPGLYLFRFISDTEHYDAVIIMRSALSALVVVCCPYAVLLEICFPCTHEAHTKQGVKQKTLHIVGPIKGEQVRAVCGIS
jgi:hypothetical protein